MHDSQNPKRPYWVVSIGNQPTSTWPFISGISIAVVSGQCLYTSNNTSNIYGNVCLTECTSDYIYKLSCQFKYYMQWFH